MNYQTQKIMTTEQLNQITEIVQNNTLISERIIKLRALGFYVKERAMGSGGVLQVQKSISETRVQIGYGHGRYNYAFTVIL